MSTETKESESKVEEIVDTSKGSEDKVSKPEAKVSEVKVTDTPEFKAAVEAVASKLAQSMKDKELKSIYERLSKAEKEAEEKATSLRERDEDREIDKQLGEAVEAGELTSAEKKTLQTFRDELRKKAKSHNDEVAKFRKEREGVDEERKTIGEAKLEKTINSVFRIAETQGVSLKYSEAETIAKDSEGNQKLIELMLKAQANIETKETKRPDGGGSGSGGSDSDADFEKKFARGDLPTTKANVDRYNKILEKS